MSEVEAPADVDVPAGTESLMNDRVTEVKNKRKYLRGKFTRAIKRLQENIKQSDQNKRRFEREIQELKHDFDLACELNGQLYELLDQSESDKLDQWETDICNDFYSIEEKVLDYLRVLASDGFAGDTQRPVTRAVTSRSQSVRDTGPPLEMDNNIDLLSNDTLLLSNDTVNSLPTNNSNGRISSNTNLVNVSSFDSWIDQLEEFKQTALPPLDNDMSLAQALYKLEAGKDIPAIQLTKFNGDPLGYVDFVEKFKLHIHDKSHLSDDMRLMQLQMHLEGEAQRAIYGLGSSGIMYATALKTLKDQFGQPSLITRAFVNRLTKGDKISLNNRNSLRDFSMDIVNCQATFRRLNAYADINANETLRNIIKRLPDRFIGQWKGYIADVRDKGEVPSIDHISLFLRKKVRAEFDPDFGDILNYDSQRNREGKFDKRRGVHATQSHSSGLKCYICEESHRVYECPNFRDMSVEQRVEIVKDKRLCFSCLVKGHNSKDCRSKRKCGKNNCTRTHHFMLHSDPPSASGAQSVLDKVSILPVVRVQFRSANGRIKEGNVLVDSGAGTTIIRTDFAKSLGLQGRRERLDLAVVGGERVEQHNSRRVKVWVSPLLGGEEFLIEAHEVDRTILNVPPLDRAWLETFPHMSDVSFNHKAGAIDLILGVQYSHLHAEQEIRQGLPFEPLAKRTRLGWFVIGPDNTRHVSSVCSVNLVQNIDIKKFYDFETMGVQVPNCVCEDTVMSADDKKALELMEASCVKKGNRYQIGLPWKTDPNVLCDNYPLAEKRLVSLENKLKRCPERGEMYKEAVGEYIKNDWARILTSAEVDSEKYPVYYLPHHGIYRPDKLSTHLRVVFDPASPYRGISLNSLLYKGPCLIGNLLGVLLRFREEAVAFVGDISKMYLQILIPESDSQVHRFLWRDLDTTREPDVYCLQRVAFGDKPSPDMASFVVLKIAEEVQESLPEASVILKRDRYMDDLIHSCETSRQAVKCMDELDKALVTGSFKVKEWICSRNVDMSDVSSSNREIYCAPVNLDGEDVKTLGVGWNPNSDMLKFMVKDIQLEIFTKRNILSKISTIFDPMGLASALTIKARIAMQDIWRLKKFGWDDVLPEDMCEVWRQIFRDIDRLREIEYPRCVKPDEVISNESELHVFVDASSVAYGAVAYIVWCTSKGREVRLVSAKARVAPLHQVTIPRLELMAALVGSRLARTIFEHFKTVPSRAILWSDSQIVLHWIKSESITLKAFVGVRVSEIQSTWKSDDWRFVPTKLNPADDLSRGVTVDGIGRWRDGPKFLKMQESDWPKEGQCSVDETLEKKHVSLGVIASAIPSVPILELSDFSSLQRLLRVTAFCMRFVRNARLKQEDRDLGSLQRDEIGKAEMYWVKYAQKDLTDWTKRFKDLSPFLDNGVLRVGGSLGRSGLVYDVIHPILLTGGSHLAKLIMRTVHDKVGHAGTERTLAESRRKFWIVRGRNLAKQTVRSCLTCRKWRQPPHTTLMADLPPARMRPFSPAFSLTGVDLFGPMHLKCGRNKTVKAWGALFTCATVRAIHLEIVADLSTESFLQALRQFAAYRGWPDTFISDNGTNFVGAQKELRQFYKNGLKQIEDFVSLHKVKWVFNTPLSPNQGGFFESLVKQAKKAIQVAIGNQTLSWNEMSTVMAEAMCLVNSRPLGYASNDPNDFHPITPNHFLLGRSSADIPQGPFNETKNLRKRFEFVQSLVHQFWRRFIREYVPTLLKRAKWQLKGRQLQVNDIVLLIDVNLPRGKWCLGRIIEVYPGADGVVRNVLVKTKNGEYRRSIQKCCPLLEADHDTNSIAAALGPRGYVA